MKSKVINAATCDARDVTEESLAGFDSVTINAAVLIVGDRSRALLNRYAVKLNAAAIIEIPEGENVSLRSVNGKGEIGPDADGAGIFLLVNGRLTVLDGSAEAVKSFYRIVVNGTVLMPKSCQGQFRNLQVNGKTEYYPDGAAILKPDAQIDELFALRAAKPFYYCSGTLFFLDAGLDAETLSAKGTRFAAKKIVIARGLLAGLVAQFDEEAEIVRVPDGTNRIDGDLELTMKVIRKYGPRLCVCGDVSIRDAEALSALEYLFTDGTVSVDRPLEEAFEARECVCGELKLVDPEQLCISDRPSVRIGAAMLKEHPNGILVEDCAKVTLSEDLSPEDILKKLRISDCALVVCSREQEEAVHMIAEDTALIRVARHDGDGTENGSLGGILGSILGIAKDTQVINAAEYKL